MSAVYRLVMHSNSIIMLVSGDEELPHVIDSTCCRKIIYSLVSLQGHNLTPIFLGLWIPQLPYHMGTCCTTILSISSILQSDWKAMHWGCRVVGERITELGVALNSHSEPQRAPFQKILVTDSTLMPVPFCHLSCLPAISHRILTIVK